MHRAGPPDFRLIGDDVPGRRQSSMRDHKGALGDTELCPHYGAETRHRLQAEVTRDLAGHSTDAIFDVIRD